MYPLGVRNCSYLVSPNLSLFLLVVGCHLIYVWDGFHKPTTILFFSLLVFQQLRSILLARMLVNSYCDNSCHSFLHSLLPLWASSYSLVPEALWCCSFGSIMLFYQDHGVPLFYLVVCCEYCLILPSYRIFCPIFLPKCCRNFPWILASFSYHSSSLCNLQGSLVSLVCQRSD